jgi:hypothetical protein
MGALDEHRCVAVPVSVMVFWRLALCRPALGFSSEDAMLNACTVGDKKHWFTVRRSSARYRTRKRRLIRRQR